MRNLPRLIQAAIALLSLGAFGLLVIGWMWLDDVVTRHRVGVLGREDLRSPLAAALPWVPMLVFGIIGLAKRAPWGFWLSLVGAAFPLVFFAFIVRKNRSGWHDVFLLELAYMGVFLAALVTLFLGRRACLSGPSSGA